MTDRGHPPEDVAAIRAELAEIAAGLRAHAEQFAACGTTGVPHTKAQPRLSRASEPVSAPPRAVAPSSESPQSLPSQGAQSGRALAPSPAPPQEGRSAGASPPSATAPQSRRSTGASPVDIAALHLVPISVPSDGTARLSRLRDLASEIRSCDRCALCRGRTQTVFSRGSPTAELCFVGEGPGFDEDQQGEPFVGQAGQLLDRMIAAMGFGRDEVYVCNIVKCRPPGNRKPEPVEMAACVPYLVEQLQLVSPKTMVALGATAVEGLLGAVTGGITRLRGQWRLYRGAIPVMPTFHPAYLLRNPAAKREVWSDLQAVVKQMGRTLPGPTR